MTFLHAALVIWCMGHLKTSYAQKSRDLYINDNKINSQEQQYPPVLTTSIPDSFKSFADFKNHISLHGKRDASVSIDPFCNKDVSHKYQFSSLLEMSGGSSGGDHGSFKCTVYISCQGPIDFNGKSAHSYSLRISEVLMQSNNDPEVPMPDDQFSLPFRFIRDMTGLIVGVESDEQETTEISDIKKGITEVNN